MIIRTVVFLDMKCFILVDRCQDTGRTIPLNIGTTATCRHNPNKRQNVAYELR